jgi:hypothetical protein
MLMFTSFHFAHCILNAKDIRAEANVGHIFGAQGKQTLVTVQEDLACH